MPRQSRRFTLALFALFLGFLLLAVVLWTQGLDRADKWASIGSLFVGMAALIAAVWTALRPRSASAVVHGSEHPAAPLVKNMTAETVIVGNRSRVKIRNRNMYRR